MNRFFKRKNAARLIAFVSFLCYGLLISSSPGQPSPTPAPPTPDATPSNIEDRLHAALAEPKTYRRFSSVAHVINPLTLEEIPVILEAASRLPRDRQTKDLRDLYASIFTHWAALRDPQSLIPEAEKIPDAALRNAANAAILKVIAKKDPAAAFARILALPPGNRRDTLVNNHLAKWAQDDPDAALHAIETSDASLIPVNAINSIIVGQAHQNPARALKLWLTARQEKSPRATSQFLENLATIFRSFGQIDPIQGTVQAKALSQEDWRNIAYSGLAEGWSIGDPQAAYRWFQENKLGTPQIIATLFRTWAQRDPVSAVAGLDTLSQADQKIMRILAGNAWAGTDPVAALTWALTLSPSSDRTTILHNIITTQADRDPATAATESASIPPSPERNNAIEVICNRWARIDGSAAAKWLETLTSADEKSIAIQSLMEQWPAADFPNASAFAASLPAGNDRTASIALIINGTLRKQYPDLAIWLATLPADDESSVVEQFSEFWTRQSPDASFAWISSLPVGPVRDKALSGFSLTMPGNKAASVLPMTALIKDPVIRKNAMFNAAATWLTEDVDSAAAWIAESKLDNSEKRQLLSAALRGKSR